MVHHAAISTPARLQISARAAGPSTGFAGRQSPIIRVVRIQYQWVTKEKILAYQRIDDIFYQNFTNVQKMHSSTVG